MPFQSLLISEKMLQNLTLTSKQAVVSFTYDNKEGSVFQNFKLHTRPSISALQFTVSLTMIMMERDIEISIEISTYFIKVFILVCETVTELNDFQSDKGRTREKTDFERTIHLEVSAAAQPC